MKKKIIFAVATGLFAVATLFNMNFAQSNYTGDLSLESIQVMAQAQGESGDPKYCWTGVYLGGILTVTPCGEYTPNTLPPYKCGSPINFAWNGGSRKQCY